MRNTGPSGERRPADAVGRAVHVAKIATGEINDTKSKRPGAGVAGGKARAKALDPATRTDIAKKAAAARWAER